MKRRSFLKMLGLGAGAIAFEQAIPFNRVWSFPKTIVPAGSFAIPPGYSVRFISAWDPFAIWDPEFMEYYGRTIHRVDVGDRKLWRDEIPSQVASDDAYVIRNPNNSPLVVTLPKVDQDALAMLKRYREENPEKEICGVTWG